MLREENVWGEQRSAFRSHRTQRVAARLAIAILLIAPCPAISSGQSGVPGLTENLPPGAMQAKATTACTECHEARIILQQRLSKPVWTKEVDKMIKWGAVVDASDHDALVDYLSTNFGVDRPPYQPLRTTANKTGSSK